MAETVRDNRAEHRFELDVAGELAVAYYGADPAAPGVIVFTHTEVPQALSGRGVASRLIGGALEQVRGRGLKVAAKCPFVSAYLGKHPEFSDLIA